MTKSSVKEWLKGNTGKILVSVFEIIIGILLFIDPVGFTNGIIIACGVIMLLLGIINVIKYFTTKLEIATTETSLFTGLLLLAIGCFCVFKSEWFIQIMSVVSILYGIVFALFGLSCIQEVVNMIRLRNNKWYLELINAVIMTVFAVIIFVNPFGAGQGIWIFTGVVLIVSAIYNIVILAVLSKSPKVVVPIENSEN